MSTRTMHGAMNGMGRKLGGYGWARMNAMERRMRRSEYSGAGLPGHSCPGDCGESLAHIQQCQLRQVQLPNIVQYVSCVL
jgi:hypothetical protein